MTSTGSPKSSHEHFNIAINVLQLVQHMAICVSFQLARRRFSLFVDLLWNLENHHGQKIQDSLSRAGQPFGAVSESWLAVFDLTLFCSP
jgi:hypothetical protein